LRGKLHKEILFIMLASVVNIIPAKAQVIITDRPDQTGSSSTIQAQSFQIETGILTGFSENVSVSEREFLFPTTLLRYGLTRNIELRIAGQLESHKLTETSSKSIGASDLEIGAKVQVLKKEGLNTEIAFLSHLVVPTGSPLITSGKVGIINKIAVSHGINSFMGVGYNLGYSYLGTGNGDLIYSFVFGAGIKEKAALFAEFYGELAGLSEPVLNLDSGFTYLVSDNFQVDLSYGIGLIQRMYFFSGGFSWNIR
jgi:hypothetical protein